MAGIRVEHLAGVVLQDPDVVPLSQHVVAFDKHHVMGNDIVLFMSEEVSLVHAIQDPPL